MSAKNRATNKSVFETGDKPTGSDYANLIDSFLSLVDTTAQSVTSDLVVPVLQATSINARYGTFSSVSAAEATFGLVKIETTVTASTSNPTGVEMPTKCQGFMCFKIGSSLVAVPYFEVQT
jgi:hypothetical protein